MGDIFVYYPNGRFYNKKSVVKTVTEESELQFRDCSDSTGKVLAENGNGQWVTYDDAFTHVISTAKVKDGHLSESDMRNTVFTAVEKEPVFPSGVEAFYKFLSKDIKVE